MLFILWLGASLFCSYFSMYIEKLEESELLLKNEKDLHSQEKYRCQIKGIA